VATIIVTPSPNDDLDVALVTFAVFASIDFDAVDSLRWLLVVVTAEQQ
jgi:hypothetical protein